MQQAMDETRDEAVAVAKARCPVDTGALQRSIHGDVTVAGGKRTLVLAADESYALYVELGTSRAPAQPFLRPAVDAAAPKLTQRLRAALGGR